MRKIKYGEAYVAKHLSMYMVDGVFVTNPLKKHEDRMTKTKAAKYYTAKINKVMEW